MGSKTEVGEPEKCINEVNREGGKIDLSYKMGEKQKKGIRFLVGARANIRFLRGTLVGDSALDTFQDCE